MSTPIRASDQDLRALAEIVSADRPDSPSAEEGLPPSLLADLISLIRCDFLSFVAFDTSWQAIRCAGDPAAGDDAEYHAFWEHYWDCEPASYPDRTGDLRTVVKTSDFYSARQWHSTGMYRDYKWPLGLEHEIMLCLPNAPGQTRGHGHNLRMIFLRGRGKDFSERDRALLTLLRPHLYEAYLDSERQRHPVPRLTPRQWDLLHLLAAGHTNTQIARRLGISESTVRTHLENIYGKLGVSSRTAAVTRAFPDRVA